MLWIATLKEQRLITFAFLHFFYLYMCIRLSSAEAFDSVLHEHGDGHRSYPTRHGRDGTRNRRNAVEIHVADQAVVHTVDAHVDDRCARLHVVRRNHLRPSYGGDKDIRLAAHGRKVLSAAMGDGNRGIPVQKEFGNGLAHDIASADHHGFLARNLHARLVEQGDDALGGAREDAGLVEPKARYVLGVEAVHILFGGDGGDDFLLVDMLGQRQLHQDAVHLRVVVEGGYLLQEALFGAVLRQFDEMSVHADVLRGFDFAAHIGAACGVVPHDNDHEARTPTVLFFKVFHLDLHPVFERLGEFLSADDIHCYSAQWAMSFL